MTRVVSRTVIVAVRKGARWCVVVDGREVPHEYASPQHDNNEPVLRNSKWIYLIKRSCRVLISCTALDRLVRGCRWMMGVEWKLPLLRLISSGLYRPPYKARVRWESAYRPPYTVQCSAVRMSQFEFRYHYYSLSSCFARVFVSSLVAHYVSASR